MYRPSVTKLNHNEALLYLGYRGGQVPPEVASGLNELETILLSFLRPRVTWRVFDLEEGSPVGCAFRPQGADAAALLAESRRVILLAATLGAETDGLLMRTEVYDMGRAVMLDALASVAVEAVCDDLETYLRERFAAEGLHLTDRFSPGYGDMPIDQQRELCTVLDSHRQIGLTVSSAGLLIPRKSVTAIMGVADTPQPKRAKGCQYCSLFHSCPYRKDGMTCGK